MPGIVSGLHAHPNCGAVAKQLAEPNRNRRRNRLAFAQNVMEMPAGNTEKRAMRFSFRQRSVTDGATFPLTSVPITVTSRASRSSTGASGCDPDCGASAAPAGGVRNPAPGRLRDPARPALRPVCEELAALAPERAKSPFASGDSRKRGPRLSGGVRSPKREPRWSAERRARPAGRASAPAAQASGNACLRGADNGWMRLSALRLPSLFRGGHKTRPYARGTARNQQSSGAGASRGGMHFHPPPRSGGGGPREAWWRGPLTSRFVCVAER